MAEAVAVPAVAVAVAAAAEGHLIRPGGNGFLPRTAGESRDVGFRADRALGERYSVR